MTKLLKNKSILLGVGGGIAAYKSCDIVRRLQDLGANVRVVLTRSAQTFVTPLTFQALSQNPVHTDLLDLTEESEMGHIKLADEAHGVLIAPATADLMAKMAAGMADDLLTTLILVTRAPVLLAPSMNVNMWEKAVVQENLKVLIKRGYQFLEPEVGSLACGWEGKGRLADPEKIAESMAKLVSKTPSNKKKSLSKKRVLINAGPTREFIDPVRFISNPSSGKMGFALAQEAQFRGAQVTLVAGPCHLSTPNKVKRINVSTAQEMLKACQRYFIKSDIFIATAAVGDYRVAKIRSQKLKKTENNLELNLVRNPDILKSLSAKKKRGHILVGFAAESQRLIEYAKNKLKEKKLDLVIANNITQSGIGFDYDENQVILINRNNKTKRLKKMSKSELAQKIWDEIEKI